MYAAGLHVSRVLQRILILTLSMGGNFSISLEKLEKLKILEVSNDDFEWTIQSGYKNSLESHSKWTLNARNMLKLRKLLTADSPQPSKSSKRIFQSPLAWVLLAVGIGLCLLFAYYAGKKSSKLAKEKEILKSLYDSPNKVVPSKPKEEEIMSDDARAELIFFVEGSEAFRLEDLLEAAADLRRQSLCSSLYKVTLKNNLVYTVKRFKKLQVSFDEFGRTMRKIGNMKHPNVLPLVGYNSTKEEKLLIYRYQSNGSLLNLLDGYVEGKRDFPWRIRLFIAGGIARGLDYIYQAFDDKETVPHGNLKPSNILLGENMEPLISEYGFSKFLDPKRASLCVSNGYTAPEKCFSEEADVFSFGVILLVLLTGKTVEKTGVDLPKWVRSMVREEWTGEVFDKEVDRAARQWAFPLLNIALQCVSNVPQNRPSIAEIREKIEEIASGHSNQPASPASSVDSGHHQDCCLLHTVIPEAWDTPGSNY